MKQLATLSKALAIAVVTAALAPAVMAQATRTWVSGLTGNDANPCSLTAPCKTFAGAISATADGGIIDVLDSGGFGSVTITKSIVIDGSPAAVAGVLTSGTNGIVVNGAGVHVILRNLDIEGAYVGGIGQGLVGINFLQGATLTVENCRIFGFQSSAATGISVSVGASGQVMIKDTVIRDSGSGVHLETSAGQLLATLDNVTVESTSSYGVQTAGIGSVFATIKRSTIDHNAMFAVHAAGPASVINLVDSTVSFNNGVAVDAAYPGARIRISGNSIFNNATALAIAGGATIESDGTNRIAGYGSTTAPNAVLTNQ
jgi:hypothetical protein